MILGVMVRVLVVGVLVLGIAVDAGCHGGEFCWPAPGTQSAARAGTGHAPPADESSPGGCAMMTLCEGGRAVLVRQFAELIAPSRLGRSFRWLLASSWLTNLGDGITLAAGPLLVASLTRNPLAVAMAVFLQRLPWLLFGLYAGVLADRLDRRAIVIATGLVRVAILLLLTASILTHRVDVAVVLAALFLFGVTETFGDTTSTTLLPMLVGQQDLGIANSRAMTGIVVWNQLAGPPVGAFLFARHRRAVRQRRSVALAASAHHAGSVAAHGARGRSEGFERDPRGVELADEPFRDAHPGVDDLRLQRHLRRRLVRARAVGRRTAAHGRGRVRAADDISALGGILGTVSYGALERRFGWATSCVSAC